MFTGIIEDIGRITGIKRGNSDMVLSIETSIEDHGIKTGDSIAVNGICLTVDGIKKSNILIFKVMNQTVKLTSLKDAATGDKVNLERSLKYTGRINGHFVTGHIDKTEKIIKKKRVGDSTLIEISLDRRYSHFAVSQGSIAVDGISLTITEKRSSSFKISLVDYTIRNTTLSGKSTGTKVNIEFDILAKYINETKIRI